MTLDTLSPDSSYPPRHPMLQSRTQSFGCGVKSSGQNLLRSLSPLPTGCSLQHPISDSDGISLFVGVHRFQVSAGTGQPDGHDSSFEPYSADSSATCHRRFRSGSFRSSVFSSPFSMRIHSLIAVHGFNRSRVYGLSVQDKEFRSILAFLLHVRWKFLAPNNRSE